MCDFFNRIRMEFLTKGLLTFLFCCLKTWMTWAAKTQRILYFKFSSGLDATTYDRLEGVFVERRVLGVDLIGHTRFLEGLFSEHQNGKSNAVQCWLVRKNAQEIIFSNKHSASRVQCCLLSILFDQDAFFVRPNSDDDFLVLAGIYLQDFEFCNEISELLEIYLLNMHFLNRNWAYEQKFLKNLLYSLLLITKKKLFNLDENVNSFFLRDSWLSVNDMRMSMEFVQRYYSIVGCWHACPTLLIPPLITSPNFLFRSVVVRFYVFLKHKRLTKEKQLNFATGRLRVSWDEFVVI